MNLAAVRRACWMVFVSISPVVLYSAPLPPSISANDNRVPAGRLQDGVLTVHLELGEGQWHPESEEGEAFTVYAFGEPGNRLQNPGPLLRVTEGTEIDAVVHNTLSVAATVHGLHARPGEAEDVLELPAGVTREVRFKAGAAGSYFYWASTTGSTIARRTPMETQLTGAMIVDPPGALPDDRVFVLGVYFKAPAFRTGIPQEGTINGKAWPYAERVTLKAGVPVHWRWLNGSDSEHAMHLHGFYFNVDAAGDAEHSLRFKSEDRPFVVTQQFESGGTFEMTWVPDRPGRWLLHCHMMIHMSPTDWNAVTIEPQNGHGIPRILRATPEHQHGDGLDPSGMGGIVLGITVVDDRPGAKRAGWHAERKLQLAINEHREPSHPRYAVEVIDPDRPTPSAPTPPILGPPLVLTRGQPVEIEVLNRTSQPTAIHWHGIELESYYDGVAGWGGTSEQTTAAIAPGKSFVARMTPPRAGTFIYHTHWHDAQQLSNGIYGPLIVLPPGQRFETATDKVFVISEGLFEPFGSMVLINGGPQPGVLRLATGTKYRFRVINISSNFGRLRASLRDRGTPVQWRLLAKDGADVAEGARTLRPADNLVAVGETSDFEYETDTPQELTFEVA